MCTVTFVRSGTKTIITSNRDEQVERQAVEPRGYIIGGKTLTFPKDPKAGGTWYAVDQAGNVLVLLNGAFEKHDWNPPYRKSRGLILLDILSSDVPIEGWLGIDLSDIEPFTLVLFEDDALYQLRWDGSQKDTMELNPQQNHIWSSTTLYPKEIRENRAQWFAEFMSGKPIVTEADMFDFHRYTKSENSQNGLVIDRPGFLKTISITQTILQDSQLALHHYDLVSKQDFLQKFTIR